MKGLILATCALVFQVHSQFNFEVNGNGFRFGLLNTEIVNIGGQNQGKSFTNSFPADLNIPAPPIPSIPMPVINLPNVANIPIFGSQSEQKPSNNNIKPNTQPKPIPKPQSLPIVTPVDQTPITKQTTSIAQKQSPTSAAAKPTAERIMIQPMSRKQVIQSAPMGTGMGMGMGMMGPNNRIEQINMKDQLSPFYQMQMRTPQLKQQPINKQLKQKINKEPQLMIKQIKQQAVQEKKQLQPQEPNLSIQQQSISQKKEERPSPVKPPRTYQIPLSNTSPQDGPQVYVLDFSKLNSDSTSETNQAHQLQEQQSSIESVDQPERTQRDIRKMEDERLAKYVSMMPEAEKQHLRAIATQRVHD